MGIKPAIWYYHLRVSFNGLVGMVIAADIPTCGTCRLMTRVGLRIIYLFNIERAGNTVNHYRQQPEEKGSWQLHRHYDSRMPLRLVDMRRDWRNSWAQWPVVLPKPLVIWRPTLGTIKMPSCSQSVFEAILTWAPPSHTTPSDMVSSFKLPSNPVASLNHISPASRIPNPIPSAIAPL